MYSTTTKKHHFMRRAGSFSTHGFANGRVDVLPPEAQDSEIKYQEYREQIQHIVQQIKSMQDQMVEINSRLQCSLQYHEYQQIVARRERLKSKLRAAASKLKTLKERAVVAHEQSKGEVFLVVAKARLDDDVFMEINREVNELIGRNKLTEDIGVRRIETPEKRNSLSDVLKEYETDFYRVHRWLQWNIVRINELIEKHGNSPNLERDMSIVKSIISFMARANNEEIGKGSKNTSDPPSQGGAAVQGAS